MAVAECESPELQHRSAFVVHKAFRKPKNKALSGQFARLFCGKKPFACVIIGEKTMLQPKTSLQTEIKMTILPELWCLRKYT